MWRSFFFIGCSSLLDSNSYLYIYSILFYLHHCSLLSPLFIFSLPLYSSSPSFLLSDPNEKKCWEVARSTSNVRSPSHSTASAAYLHIVDTYPYSSMGMFYVYIYFTSYNISSICFDLNYNMSGRALIFLLCVMFMFT